LLTFVRTPVGRVPWRQILSDAETFTAFAGHRRIAAGPIEAVVAAVVAQGDAQPALIFNDATGQQVELDLRRGVDHALADYRARTAPQEGPAPRPGRGRPRLGVVAREVTLLPRHWEWLATQPGGASATLRRLVEDARRMGAEPERVRRAQEAAYRVMSALAGDLPGFEEASRALFAHDPERLGAIVADWPADVAAHLKRLVAAM
jgi:uncharacterized protein